MIFEMVLAIVIVRYLRKTLDTPQQMPQWDKLLLAINYAAIALLVVLLTIPALKPVSTWLGYLPILCLVYILYREPAFNSARQVLFAIAPFVLLSLFSDVLKLTNENQFHAWKALLEAATTFAGIWMVSIWVIMNRQKKALERERSRTKEQEGQKNVMASLKDQLEVQVAQRTAELTRQKEALQQTIAELRSTQAQLIQSEKMASLGELTAGIAHEIQNPLNFVNNFSEVNAELIAEMHREIEAGNFEEARSLAHDVLENEQKIIHHGKRADAIVKGMLQHSRTSSGQKESVDINALADEYLRLAYHGLRAKDKSFNATLKTDFDPNLASIEAVPQDLGRVILNLITNAFYAVTEKKEKEGPGYEPTVSVSTGMVKNKLEIRVRDNGNGIPHAILDKIFHPFFTTKPTAKGTGLGLSLSYDIIKAHGGDIRVETKEGEFAEFIIILPLK